MFNRREILIHPSTEAIDPSVLTALARLAPVRFKSCANLAKCGPADILLSLSGDDQALENLPRENVRCFHVTQGKEPSPSATADTFRFGDSSELDGKFRRRTLSHKLLRNLSFVRTEPGDEILASYGENPVWIHRRSAGFSAHIVSAPLPTPTGDERPFDFIDGEQFIQLLPLVHFLRAITADAGWANPPMRACVMFDDPNLHWITYGYVSYCEILKQAKAFGSHVTFATVPCDAWGSNRRTVNLFKENPDRLSLLIHGNNHEKNELAQTRTHEGHLRYLAQSLRRIVRLEKDTGLRVNRLTVPPHEGCTVRALSAMLELGFEGVCLPPWMLRYWNRDRLWSPGFGLDIAEMIEGGTSVIPRFTIRGSCEGPIVISAFLGLPMIPVGHHGTLSDGLEVLARVMDAINSLGDVQWRNPEMIARSNYLTFRKEAALWVKPFSCRMLVEVPEDIDTLVIAPLDESGEADRGAFKIVKRQPGTAPTPQIETGAPIKVTPGETIELISTRLGTVDYRNVKSPPFSFWALPRRMLCEGRDRSVALLPRRRPQDAKLLNIR